MRSQCAGDALDPPLWKIPIIALSFSPSQALRVSLAGPQQVPGHGDRVRKVECVYSFDTPESPEGLFVSMSNFQGLSAVYLGMEFARTGTKYTVQPATGCCGLLLTWTPSTGAAALTGRLYCV